MICAKCKHAKFVLTPKKSRIARWGTGKCMAKWEVPTIDVSKIPAVVSITVKFSEEPIHQGLLSTDPCDPDLLNFNPLECPLFEEESEDC